MWASAFLEDSFFVKAESNEEVVEVTQVKKFFSNTGEGWFESHLGVTANEFVSRLRKMRRKNKNVKHEIDDIIQDVRALKKLEVESTLSQIPWANERYDTLRGLGLSDRDLKSLRRFSDSRKTGLINACQLWEQADTSLKTLDSFEDVWGQHENQTWANAMQNKKDARKMWKTSLHQIDKLNSKDRETIEKASLVLTERGPMSSRAIFEHLSENNVVHKSMTSNKLSKLISMYGEELDITAGASRGTFVKMDKNGLILKDPFAYAAGFLDADGYITITGRGEARAGFVATGDRGRAHCEQLHKTLECGVLQLDQKVHKNSTRSQHRLQFYSKGDVEKLLKMILPHLQMKDTQAKAVLQYLQEEDPLRKTELLRVVRYNNWKDDTQKAENLLSQWECSVDDISKWSEGI
mgnify:FL=1|jgi:hypothetical protein|tara:strand:+ start:2092 stop:3315 length:1224 start_codon:yes stop_codon:yes gene_type:complete